MTLTHPKTVIKRDDMARIFELIESRETITSIARKVGYRADTIKRGLVVAKLFGFDGVA